MERLTCKNEDKPAFIMSSHRVIIFEKMHGEPAKYIGHLYGADKRVCIKTLELSVFDTHLLLYALCIVTWQWNASSSVLKPMLLVANDAWTHDANWIFWLATSRFIILTMTCLGLARLKGKFGTAWT